MRDTEKRNCKATAVSRQLYLHYNEKTVLPALGKQQGKPFAEPCFSARPHRQRNFFCAATRKEIIEIFGGYFFGSLLSKESIQSVF